MSDDFKNPFLEGSEEIPEDPSSLESRPAPEDESKNTEVSQSDTQAEHPRLKTTPAQPASTKKTIQIPPKPQFAKTSVTPLPPSKPKIGAGKTSQNPDSAPEPTPQFVSAKQTPSAETRLLPQTSSAQSSENEAGVTGLAFDITATAIAVAFMALLLQDTLPFLK